MNTQLIVNASRKNGFITTPAKSVNVNSSKKNPKKNGLLGDGPGITQGNGGLSRSIHPSRCSYSDRGQLPDRGLSGLGLR